MLTREAVEPVYTLKLSGVQKLELKLNGTLKCKTKKKNATSGSAISIHSLAEATLEMTSYESSARGGEPENKINRRNFATKLFILSNRDSYV